MKFKLFLKLGLLCTVFSGITQAQGRKRLSLTEINHRKQLYFQTEEYKELSPEVKSLVDAFAFKTQRIDGDLYRLSIVGRGPGRENEFTLRCVVNGEMKTIPQLLQAERPMTKSASNFQDWLKGQTFDPKGQWLGARVVGDLDSRNLNGNPKTTVKSLSRLAIYTHPLKPNIEVLKAAQFQQAFYKKLLDGLQTKQSVLAIAENRCSQGSQSAAQAGAQSAANAFKSTVANAAAASASTVSKSALGKMGKFGIPAVAVTGAAALAYNYDFKQKPVEEKPLSNMAQFSKFCRNNPGTTVGAVATIAALGYGAYELYNSDIFVESKKELSQIQ